jgi:hypothetical protein
LLGLALLSAACSSTGGLKTGAAGTGGSVPGAPAVASFTATPATLPEGGGRVTLAWEVTDADAITIDHGVGVVTGTSTRTMVTATTTFTLTAKNAMGSTSKSAVVTVGGSATPMDGGTAGINGGGVAGMDGSTAAPPTDGPGNTMKPDAAGNPSSMGNRYVDIVSPTPGETFIGPATLRLVGTAYDPFVDTNVPAVGMGGNAQKLQFFVDDKVVLEVDGAHAEYWVFKGFASGIAVGSHRVWARATYAKPDVVLDTAPVLIDVVAAPTYDKTVDLTADVMMAGATGYELVGAADKRIRLNGHGHSIKSDADASGPLTLKFVDVFDLGGGNTTDIDSTDVTTSGAITIEDCNFDTSNSLALVSTGAGTVSIKRNLFRSNMRQQIGQNPRGAVTGSSSPALRLKGKSTGAKVFAGNNVGAGWVQFEDTTNWMVGGDTDADSNILIGPRVGIYMEMSSSSTIRRNYSHHHYNGGWSQGSNFELSGSPTVVVEHNIVNASSWPVRGAGGEFRYNLVLDGGHQYLWPESGGSIHHNLFVGGTADVAGIFLVNMMTGAKVFNNTIDGLLNEEMVTAVGLNGGTELALTSNAIVNVPKPKGTAAGSAVTIESAATLTADYNAFADAQKNDYSDGRKPSHDVDLANAAAAMFTDPLTAFEILDDAKIWKRTITVRDILTKYRTRYTPKAGSPLIDKGDPAGGAGNDIGAVGAGTANTSDKFGVLP